jgi:hypothetical protein
MKYVKNTLALAVLFAATQANGQFNMLWSQAYNGTAQNAQDRANLVAVDRFGNTFVAGESGQLNSGQDMVVVKYGPFGGPPLEVTAIPAVSTGKDIPFALAVDDFGDVYITGESVPGAAGQSGNEQFRTAKLRGSDLEVIWNRAYGHNGQESRARDLAINADGHVFVTGFTYGASQDILTIHYDQDGNMVSGWPQVYNNSGNRDYGVAIAVGPGNNVYVAGVSNRGTTTGEDWVTLRYAGGGGEPLWEEFVTGPETGLKQDYPTDIVVDSQNRTFVCGVLYWHQGNSDAALVSYDINGNIRYNHENESALTFGLLQDSGYDGAAALDIEINNIGEAVNVFVVGHAQPVAQSNDYLTLAYSAAQGTSGETWARTPPSVGDDLANDVAVAGKGNVYVTGSMNIGAGGTHDWLTIKYNRGGQLQHSIGYIDNLAHAFAIADSCAGKTHVTGDRNTNVTDFWSILYTQSNRVNVPVSSYNLFRGSNPSGNLASLQTSDDSRFSANPGVVFGSHEYPVTLILNGSVASDVTVNELCLEVEAQASAANGILQRVEFYNYATASWVLMDERFATTTDSTLHLAAQYDPDQFLGPPATEGAPRPIQARVMFKQGGRCLCIRGLPVSTSSGGTRSIKPAHR